MISLQKEPMKPSLAKLDAFTRAYIEAALWSSTEYAFGACPCCGKEAILSRHPEPEFEQEPMCSECGVKEIANPDPMDRNYSASDIHPDSLAKMAEDCQAFQAGTSDVCEPSIAGHCFWLSRNGHGSGFFDEDSLEPSDRKELQSEAHKFGECTLYVGDDGKLHVS